MLQAKAAILAENARLIDVDVLTSLPDYEQLFNDLNFDVEDFVGLKEMHEFRINMNAAGTGSQLHYREDCTEEGWYPRPVQPSQSLSSQWKNHFKAASPLDGLPVSA